MISFISTEFYKRSYIPLGWKESLKYSSQKNNTAYKYDKGQNNLFFSLCAEKAFDNIQHHFPIKALNLNVLYTGGHITTRKEEVKYLCFEIT
jgi:hypothetical protein